MDHLAVAFIFIGSAFANLCSMPWYDEPEFDREEPSRMPARLPPSQERILGPILRGAYQRFATSFAL